MVFENIRVLVLWAKDVSAMDGLKGTKFAGSNWKIRQEQATVDKALVI